MNLNILINNPKLVTAYYNKIQKSIKILSSKQPILEETEACITYNYLSVIKTAHLLNKVELYKSFVKDPSLDWDSLIISLVQLEDSFFNNLAYIAKNLELDCFNETLNLILSNLDARGYSIDKSSIFKYIYPIQDKLVIAAVIQLNVGHLLYTCTFNNNEVEEKLDCLEDFSNTLSYFSNKGKLIDSNIEELIDLYLDKNLYSNLDNLIQKSEVFDTFIKASISDNLNIYTVNNFITKALKKFINSSNIYNNHIILKLRTNLQDKDLNYIANVLHLQDNDLYKLIALQKE